MNGISTFALLAVAVISSAPLVADQPTDLWAIARAAIGGDEALSRIHRVHVVTSRQNVSSGMDLSEDAKDRAFSTMHVWLQGTMIVAERWQAPRRAAVCPPFVISRILNHSEDKDPIVNGTVAIVLSHMIAILPPAFVMSTKFHVSCSTANGSVDPVIAARTTSLSGV
jgi:hypothetical protein